MGVKRLGCAGVQFTCRSRSSLRPSDEGSIPLLSDVCALAPPPSRGQQLTSWFLTSQGQTGAPGFPGDAGDRGYTVRPALQDCRCSQA